MKRSDRIEIEVSYSELLEFLKERGALEHLPAGQVEQLKLRSYHNLKPLTAGDVDEEEDDDDDEFGAAKPKEAGWLKFEVTRMQKVEPDAKNEKGKPEKHKKPRKKSPGY